MLQGYSPQLRKKCMNNSLPYSENIKTYRFLLEQRCSPKPAEESPNIVNDVCGA